MYTNLIRILVTLLLLAVHTGFVWSQGFVNLDFENAISPLSPNGGLVSSAKAIPGWTAYLNGDAQTSIFYNGITLGGAMVSLNDTNATGSSVDPLPIHGAYSVFLLGSPISSPVSAAIGQTGTIPGDIRSLTFWAGYTGFQVTFNGQTLDYTLTQAAPNYNIYTADISAFAGQTGELVFRAPSRTALLLDNVQFSINPAPEPSALGLLAMGGALFLIAIQESRKSTD